MPSVLRARTGHPLSQRQMVEIAKALSQNARILVLDEPSAVLGDNELEGLFAVVRSLAEQGVALVYISHRLSEVFRLTDRVVVLRDGALVGAEPTPRLDPGRLVKMMVGRELADVYPAREPSRGVPALQVRGLARAGVLHDVDLDVEQGEILGIAGLAGAGRTELLRAIAGADPVDAGRIVVDGRAVRPRSPRHALRLGIGLLPEDRNTQSLFLHQSVQFNINVAHLRDFTNAGVLSARAERREASGYVDSLGVRTPTLATPVANLSGDNQQKCVLARLLGARCRVLLVDEPTRGVDVGAKQDIYRLLAQFAAQGAAIVMVSSELPEVLGLADRIAVMREGRVSARLSRAEASEELIMRYATGHTFTGGRRMDGEHASGIFVEPTIFDGVQPHMRVFRDEIFGPVLSVVRFGDVEEAIALANDTTYGLANSVWTKNIDTALRMTRALRSGTVWVNTTIDGGPQMPFGGVKASGYGREMGRSGLEEYTELKSCAIRTGPREPFFARAAAKA